MRKSQVDLARPVSVEYEPNSQTGHALSANILAPSLATSSGRGLGGLCTTPTPKLITSSVHFLPLPW